MSWCNVFCNILVTKIPSNPLSLLKNVCQEKRRRAFTAHACIFKAREYTNVGYQNAGKINILLPDHRRFSVAAVSVAYGGSLKLGIIVVTVLSVGLSNLLNIKPLKQSCGKLWKGPALMPVWFYSLTWHVPCVRTVFAISVCALKTVLEAHSILASHPALALSPPHNSATCSFTGEALWEMLSLEIFHEDVGRTIAFICNPRPKDYALPA